MFVVNVGSKNDIKIEAVRRTLRNYPFLNPFVIRSLEALSGVSHQPMTLQEIVSGAKNRARNSFSSCDYSFGIESGLMPVHRQKQDIWICAFAQFMMDLIIILVCHVDLNHQIKLQSSLQKKE